MNKTTETDHAAFDGMEIISSYSRQNALEDGVLV